MHGPWLFRPTGVQVRYGRFVIAVDSDPFVPPQLAPYCTGKHHWKRLLGRYRCGRDLWGPLVVQPSLRPPGRTTNGPRSVAVHHHVWLGRLEYFPAAADTPFQPDRKWCHHARSERKDEFKRTSLRLDLTPRSKSIILRRNDLPGRTTLHAFSSFPTRNFRSLAVVTFLPTHD